MNSGASDNKCCGCNFSVTAAVVIVCLIFAGLVWKMREYTTPAPLGGRPRRRAGQGARRFAR